MKNSPTANLQNKLCNRVDQHVVEIRKSLRFTVHQNAYVVGVKLFKIDQ